MYVIDYTSMEQQDQLSTITLSGMCIDSDKLRGQQRVIKVYFKMNYWYEETLSNCFQNGVHYKLNCKIHIRHNCGCLSKICSLVLY